MARTIRDPESEWRTILFGTDKHPAKMKNMAKDTKIPISTLCRYKKHPSAIPLEKLQKIVRWNGLGKEDLERLFK